jgi:hypothetical protein
MNRDQVFAELAKRGIAKAVVHFSGGEDEGGVDAPIALLDSSDKVMNQMEECYDDRPVGIDKQLSKALCAPVYDKYYSFAGEYYVHGQLVWNVADRKVLLDGEESHSTYEDEGFTDEFFSVEEEV